MLMARVDTCCKVRVVTFPAAMHTRALMASFQITANLLNSYLGLDIREICSNEYNAADNNHCAHFVSHVLGLDFGMTCRRLVGRSHRHAPGANVRVHEIFAQCPQTEELVSCPTQGSALIFVSKSSNFTGTPTRLRNVPRKHIGILLNGTVWHYSNSRDRVITQTVSDFLYHYRRQRNALWIGALPHNARPQYYAGLQCSTSPAPLTATQSTLQQRVSSRAFDRVQ